MVLFCTSVGNGMSCTSFSFTPLLVCGFWVRVKPVLKFLLISDHGRGCFRGCRCPGRFFAEAQIALAVALLLSSYEVTLASKNLHTAGRPAAGAAGPGTKEDCLQTGDASGRLDAKICIHDMPNTTVAEQGSASGCGQRSAHAGSCSQAEAHGSSCSHMGAHASVCESGKDSMQECAGASMPLVTSLAEVSGNTPVKNPVSAVVCVVNSQRISESSIRGPPGDVQVLLPQPELRRQVGIRWPKSEGIVSLRRRS